MKKLLSLVLVLALCSVAGAGLLDLEIGSVGPSETGTTAITPTKQIVVNPSDWLGMDIYYTATSDPQMTLASISVELTVTGPGVIDLVTEHKTEAGTAGVMQLTEPAGAWDKDLRWINVLQTGTRIVIDYSFDFGVAGVDDPTIALDHIMFHCEGPGLVTITMADTRNSHAMETLEINKDYVWNTPQFGGAVTIYTPEPATIALLCLGGLLLRKKK